MERKLQSQTCRFRGDAVGLLLQIYGAWKDLHSDHKPDSIFPKLRDIVTILCYLHTFVEYILRLQALSLPTSEAQIVVNSF